MENANEAAVNTSNSLTRINQIVNANLQKTWRLQANTKYLKAECENLDREIKDLKEKIEAEIKLCNNLEVNLERTSKNKDTEICTINLIVNLHPQLVQRKIDEINKLKECIYRFDFTYNRQLENFEQFKRNTETKNPLLKKLCTINAEISKLEFDKKFLKEKIKDAKRTCRLKSEIYQKIFHSVTVKFVEAVSKYHQRKRVMSELKEKEVLLEHQHKQYKLKYLEAEKKSASESISYKIEIPKINLQLSGNPKGNSYQSILPKIPLRSSCQNYEMPNTDISSILIKYKKKSEELNEKIKKVDLFTTKKSDQTTAKKSNEIKQTKIQHGTKRSFEEAQLTKEVKKSFKQQKTAAQPEIGNQTKVQGIIKNVENANKNEHVTLSQKRVPKQVTFTMKDGNSKENASDKAKLPSSTDGSKMPAMPRKLSFTLRNQESQALKNTNQTVNTQNKKDLKFPAVRTSFNFGEEPRTSRDRNATGKNTEQKTVTNKNVKNPESGSSFIKPANFNAMKPLQEEQGRDFSPYFIKSEKSSINEVQEKVQTVTTDLAEYDGEAEQYLPFEFLTPQEEEFSVTQNITFLGEDQHVSSGEEQSGFMFNLGQPSSKGSFKPFSFFN